MSLEVKLDALTAAVLALTTVMQTGAAAPQQFGQVLDSVTNVAGEAAGAEKATRTRRTKAQIEADNAAAATGARTINSNDVVTGDPEGTRYWVIEAHNTVYAQKPGEPDVTIEGKVQVGAIEYLNKKEAFAKKSLTSAPAAQTGATTTSTDSSPKQDDAVAVSFKDVTDALMQLNQSTAAGHGHAGLKAFLAKHAVERVPALQALNKNAELLAEINALLTPATDDNLFG